MNPYATYWTVFDNGPVDLMLPEGVFQIEVTGHYIDGCDWKGIETFTPVDQQRYSYTYDEQLVQLRSRRRRVAHDPHAARGLRHDRRISYS